MARFNIKSLLKIVEIIETGYNRLKISLQFWKKIGYEITEKPNRQYKKT